MREAEVSLSDITIAQMRNGARECEWRHAPEACADDLGDFEKSLLSWELDPEREGSTFAGSLRPDEFARYGRRTRWRGVQMKKTA